MGIRAGIEKPTGGIQTISLHWWWAHLPLEVSPPTPARCCKINKTVGSIPKNPRFCFVYSRLRPWAEVPKAFFFWSAKTSLTRPLPWPKSALGKGEKGGKRWGREKNNTGLTNNQTLHTKEVNCSKCGQVLKSFHERKTRVHASILNASRYEDLLLQKDNDHCSEMFEHEMAQCYLSLLKCYKSRLQKG